MMNTLYWFARVLVEIMPLLLVLLFLLFALIPPILWHYAEERLKQLRRRSKK